MKQYFKKQNLEQISLISATVDLYLSSEEYCCQARFSTVRICLGVCCVLTKLKSFKTFEFICLNFLYGNLYKILQLNSIAGNNLLLKFKPVLVMVNLHHGVTIIRFEVLIFSVVLLSIISYNVYPGFFVI